MTEYRRILSSLIERRKANDEILAGYKSKIAESEKRNKEKVSSKYADYYKAVRGKEQALKERFSLPVKKPFVRDQVREKQQVPLPLVAPVATGSAVSFFFAFSLFLNATKFID